MNILFKLFFIFTCLCVSNLTFGFEMRAVNNGKKYKATTSDLLKSHMKLVSFRHKILSENIANLNTPGYKAKEVNIPENLGELAEEGKGRHKKIRLAITSNKHLRGINSENDAFSAHKSKDFLEVKKNGNNVSLAQQVNKISQNQASYDTDLKILATTNGLFSTVLGK